jgi:pimeloyl-ACP methyl ester carboxylesterase
MPTTTTPQVRFRAVDGIRIRYADTGGLQKPAVVLTSPWPESVYAFTSMWASLSGHARLFAVDLPGFGASERREDLMSPRAMGGFLAQLIDEADLGTPHIVAPDVGTAAALFAAAAHPERVASVTVGTDVRADYLACYDGDRFAESMRYVRRYPEELPVLARAAAADHRAGHDHQRPPRPRSPTRQRGIP